VRKEERAALTRLIDHFDAEVLVNITPPPTRMPRERAMARGQIAEQYESCTGCSLHQVRQVFDDIGAEYPNFTTPMHLTVVTAFPPVRGEQYRKMVEHAVKRHVPLANVAWVPVIGCVPRNELGGVLRPASKIEVRGCQANFHRSIEAAGAPHVLFVGKDAMAAWRDDLTIEQVRNVTGVFRGTYLCSAVDHPANAKRKSERVQWIEDAAHTVWRLMNETGLEVRGCTTKGCIKPFLGFDGDGIGWCAEHLNPKEKPRVREFVDEELPL
jgi:hypothetical protein